MANAPSLTVGLLPALPDVKGKPASGFLGSSTMFLLATALFKSIKE